MTLEGNHHTLEVLDTLLGSFFDLATDTDDITGPEFGEIGAALGEVEGDKLLIHKNVFRKSRVKLSEKKSKNTQKRDVFCISFTIAGKSPAVNGSGFLKKNKALFSCS